MNELCRQAIKYGCVGVVVVAINMSILYSLTEFLHVYYIASALLAFCVAFIASFFLQKRVTFNDTSAEHAASKVVRYLSLQIANVGTNTFLLFIFVEYLKIWYILAELVIALGLAVVTFIISRRFIFNRQVNNTQ